MTNKCKHSLSQDMAKFCAKILAPIIFALLTAKDCPEAIDRKEVLRCKQFFWCYVLCEEIVELCRDSLAESVPILVVHALV